MRFLQIAKPRFKPTVYEKVCRRDGLPKPISTGGNIFLSFVSSRNLSLTRQPSGPSSSSRKFKFTLELASHGCGGVLLSPFGSLSSPNWATPADTFALPSGEKSYPNSVECEWTVKAVPDFHLEFSFNSRFDVESSPNCTNDFLLFEERYTEFTADEREEERWKVLKRLCGHETPQKVISSTNTVRVTFRTNDRVVGDGFKVDYEQVCGGK